LNRQTKRAMKRQERQQKAPARPAAKQSGKPQRERTKPRQFIREVIAELKKVAWPSREETIAYSIVVLVGVIIIAALIFMMDYAFTRAVLALFGVDV
jgi:preprotein translocase subunit SecE